MARRLPNSIASALDFQKGEMFLAAKEAHVACRLVRQAQGLTQMEMARVLRDDLEWSDVLNWSDATWQQAICKAECNNWMTDGFGLCTIALDQLCEHFYGQPGRKVFPMVFKIADLGDKIADLNAKRAKLLAA